jgi:hypothetical protein
VKVCFSATASFTAAAALLGIGTVTVRRVSTVRELPYALIPALFGLQQAIEGGLWLTFADNASHLNASLTHIYQFFSHVLWPVYVPIAVYLLEEVHWRRRLLIGFSAAGSAVGLYLFYFLLTDPTTSRVTGNHIDYISPHFYVGGVISLYVLATCASSLISSHRAVRWFGMGTAASLSAAAIFYWTWFISVWCFFAAIMSLVVLSFFRRRNSARTA